MRPSLALAGLLLVSFLLPSGPIAALHAQPAPALPGLGSLGPDDPIYLQHQEELAEAYRRLAAAGRDQAAALPAPLFYLYEAKSALDLFSLAARLNLPYDSLASLNRLDRSRGVNPGERLVVPGSPGLYFPEKPGNDLELLLSYRAAEGERRVLVGGVAYRYLPGARFSAEERALFLGALFRMPLPRAVLTSGYGLRASPISGRTSMHAGIDLAAPAGTEVYAVREGKVAASGLDPTLGEYVAIEHEGGWQTVYGHLSRREVRLNERVESGMIVGRVGSTGLSTGPHLHFEVRNRGESRNPEDYLPKVKR